MNDIIDCFTNAIILNKKTKQEMERGKEIKAENKNLYSSVKVIFVNRIKVLVGAK